MESIQQKYLRIVLLRGLGAGEILQVYQSSAKAWQIYLQQPNSLGGIPILWKHGKIGSVPLLTHPGTGVSKDF